MSNTDQKQSQGGSPEATDDLEKASLDTVYEKLGTSPTGLASSEAQQRLARYGRNQLVEEEISDLQKFLRFFTGPIAYMIEAAALLSLLMGHWADLAIILVLLFYNAISGFWQERKASDALAALKAGMAPRATALRDGEPLDHRRRRGGARRRAADQAGRGRARRRAVHRRRLHQHRSGRAHRRIAAREQEDRRLRATPAASPRRAR
jgi:hypothetical protein